MQITSTEINEIKRLVELSVGTLMLCQEEQLNEAEKLKLFITSSRILGRTILWGTTINHFQLPYFIWRVSFGFHLQLDTAIEILIQYGCTILQEIQIYEERVATQGLLEVEDDSLDS